MIAAWMLLLVPAAGPLVATPAMIDAGEVFAGQPLVRSFSLRNVSSDIVTITEVRASCGCAAPKLDRRSLEPGQSTTITLDVNTLSQPAGPIRWALTVRWRSAGTDGELPLELTARLIREIELQPAALALYANAGLHHDLTLCDHRAKPLAITDVRTTGNHVQAQAAPAGPDEHRRQIVLSVGAHCPEGVHHDVLVITTDDPKYTQLRVPITVTKKPQNGVEAFPARAVLAGGNSVLVQLRAMAPVQIEAIDTGHPAITTRWAAGPGSFATLRIGLDGQKWDGRPFESQVRVRFQSPAGAAVSIPVAIRADEAP